jgi:hypothetical protein
MYTSKLHDNVHSIILWIRLCPLNIITFEHVLVRNQAKTNDACITCNILETNSKA